MKIQGLSIVIPVFNELENIKPLAVEILAALKSRLELEIIFVDDASTDATVARLQALQSEIAELRIVRHLQNRGQSAAVVNGVRAAKYAWVATLDGDRQNNPADLNLLLDAIEQKNGTPKLCMGRRIKRQDTWLRRISSKIANGVRRKFLQDDCPDSGCGIKIFNRTFFLNLPLFKNCHRFLPVLFRRAGAEIVYIPVSHRERVEGVSKYGVMNRLWVGIIDLFGVAWLMRRFIIVEGQNDV